MAYAMGRTPAKNQQRPEDSAEVDPGTDPLAIGDLLHIGEQGSPDPGTAKAPPLVNIEEPVDVRRLTGEWEKGLKLKEKLKTISPSRKTNVRPKPTTTTIATDKTKAKRRLSIEASDKGTSIGDRMAEAKKIIIKGKTSLGEARNLKGEIKIEVTRALDNLYLLVKEAEIERKRSKGKKIDKEEEEEGNPEPSGPKKDEEKLLNKIEENRRLLLENRKKMEEMEKYRLNTEIQRRDSNKPDATERDGHILEKINENNRLLKENERRVQELKEMVERQKESLGKGSYASIATEGKKPENKASERRTLHSVVVTSQDEQETGEEVLEKIRKAVDAREGWIKVEKVRKAKDRKIIMGCSTREDRERIKQRIEKAGQHLVVENMRNKDPLLVLKDVFMMNSDEEVIIALRNQNREVFQGLDDEENRISIKYKKRTRNPHAGHIVITVSPTIWGRATEQGRLRIDLQNVVVEDQSPLVQCSKCLGYGHGRRFCKAPADLCSHCGGLHLGVDCPQKTLGEVPICVNCKKINSMNTGHNAFSRECPVRRKWDGIARASIQYC